MSDDEFEFSSRKRKFGKDDAIYGSFLEEELDDKPSNLKPVQFASAGAQSDDDSEEDSEEASAPAYEASLGEWERTTKGIGSRLLAKAGYQGGGLGKDGRGITVPIEVTLRPGRAGLGAVNEMSDTMRAQVKRIHKSLHKEKKSKNKDDDRKESIAQGALKQLKWNTTQARSFVSQKLEQAKREIAHDGDHLIILDNETNTLKNSIEQQELEKSHLKFALDSISLLKSLDGDAESVSIEQSKQFEIIEEKIGATFGKFSMWRFEFAIAVSSLRRLFASWDALAQPNFGTRAVRAWYNTLLGSAHEACVQTYQHIVYATVLPRIVDALKNWRVFEHAAALDLIAAWQPLLPDRMLKHLIDLLFPKLQHALHSWDPTEATLSPLVWLKPWFVLLGDRTQALSQLAQHKLAHALSSWHPSDESAHQLLCDWNSMLQPRDMETLLYRSIVPKLTAMLKAVPVDPVKGRPDAMAWLVRWLDLIPVSFVVPMLESEFFPRWNAQLRVWLGGSALPEPAEVAGWYSSWKSTLPSEIGNIDRIRSHFTRALNSINTAFQL